MNYETKENLRLVAVHQNQTKAIKPTSIYYRQLIVNGGLKVPDNELFASTTIPLSVLKTDWQLFTDNLQCDHSKPSKWMNWLKLYIERWEFKADAFRREVQLQCFACGQWHKFPLHGYKLDINNETKEVTIQWIHELTQEKEDVLKPDDNLYKVVVY